MAYMTKQAFKTTTSSKHSGPWTGSHPITGATWSVRCGDAATVLATLPADRYACAITSPPYYWQRDYGVDGQLGMEPTVDGYVAAIRRAAAEVRRVLQPNGVLFLNLGDTYYSGKGRPTSGSGSKHPRRRFSVIRAVDAGGFGPPKKTLLGMPWRVALALIDDGWILRSDVAWRRASPVPEPTVRDRPWRTYEHVFIFARTRRYRFNRRPLLDVGEEDVWTIPAHSLPGRDHPAVFPAALVERCLAVGNPDGGPVLDPFAGTATTLRVATAAGLLADGIDLHPGYCRAAAKRLKAGR